MDYNHYYLNSYEINFEWVKLAQMTFSKTRDKIKIVLKIIYCDLEYLFFILFLCNITKTIMDGRLQIMLIVLNNFCIKNDF